MSVAIAKRSGEGIRIVGRIQLNGVFDSIRNYFTLYAEAAASRLAERADIVDIIELLMFTHQCYRIPAILDTVHTSRSFKWCKILVIKIETRGIYRGNNIYIVKSKLSLCILTNELFIYV